MEGHQHSLSHSSFDFEVGNHQHYTVEEEGLTLCVLRGGRREGEGEGGRRERQREGGGEGKMEREWEGEGERREGGEGKREGGGGRRTEDKRRNRTEIEQVRVFNSCVAVETNQQLLSILIEDDILQSLLNVYSLL